MVNSIPVEISKQVSQTCDVINHYLESKLQAIHLYGSAVDGGLKPYSDIDLLVTVGSGLDETTRKAFMLDLLEISAPPGTSEIFRALEVTVVVQYEVLPWRYPVKRELQFGDWLRKEILEGCIESAVIDADLVILLTKARQHSIPLLGPPAKEFFDQIPKADFFRALFDTLKQWASPSDWAGDERNVVLTFARMWYSAMTGNIVPKDVAADWSIKRLPVDYQSILLEAQQAYLGIAKDHLALRSEQTTESILFMKSQIVEILNNKISDV